MPKDEGLTQVAVEEPAKPEESPVSDVTVDLEKPATPPPQVSEAEQLAAAIREDFEKLYGGRLKQLEDGLSGARRINERLQRELDTAKQTATVPPPVTTPSKAEGDELDKLVEAGRWKEAVRILGRQEAEAMLKQQETLRQQQETLLTAQRTQEQAKQEVMARYPDLDLETGNPDSEVSKAYVSVLNQHPEYLQNVLGPKLAMHDMEDLLRSKGVDPGQFQVAAPARPGTNQEVIRRAQVNASTLPTSRGSGKGTVVTLTKEQKEFCDYHKIKYEEFAKTLHNLEQTGGVGL